MTRRRPVRKPARTAGAAVSDGQASRALTPGAADEASDRANDQHEQADADDTTAQQESGGVGSNQLGTACDDDLRSTTDRSENRPGSVLQRIVQAKGARGGAQSKARRVPVIQVDQEESRAERQHIATTLQEALAEVHSSLPIDPQLLASPHGPDQQHHGTARAPDQTSRSPPTGTQPVDQQHGPADHPPRDTAMAFPAVGHGGRPSTATSEAAYNSGSFAYADGANGSSSGYQQPYPPGSSSMDPHMNGGDRPGSSSHNNGGGSGQSADGSASANKSPSALGGGKIFKCMGFPNCDMTFTRSEHLARHVRKHTGERPFPCHCHKSFSRLDNLRQHAATVHSDQQELNERMLRALAPVHAALSQRAGKEQKKRGEVLELPKAPSEKRSSRASMSHTPALTPMQPDRPGSSSGGVVYNGQGYGWSHAQGTMIPPQSTGVQQDMKQRMGSVGGGWDSASASAAGYGRPGTAQTMEPPRSSHGMMGMPPAMQGRMPEGSSSARPSTAGNSGAPQRFARDGADSPAMPPQASRPMTASEGQFNPFPYGIRPGGGGDNASNRGAPAASGGHGRTMSDAGAMPGSSGGYAGAHNGMHGTAETSIGQAWPPTAQAYGPPMSSGSQHYAPTGPPYSAAYTEDSYGPAPPATAPSMYHFGSAQTPARFAADDPIAQAFHGQYSGSSGHTSSRGGSNTSSGPRQGGIASHVSQAQINELYGNHNSGNQESPFSYHPPPTATGVPPPFAGNGAGQPLANYPVSPGSPGTLGRKRPISSRGGPEYGAALPPSKMARTDATGPPFDPSQGVSAPGELWFPPRGERRSSLAISSLLTDPTTVAHDGKTDWHSSSQSATLAPGPGHEMYGDYAYDGRSGHVPPGWAGGHQQGYVADYGEHDGRHQHQQLIDMDAKAKALLAQQYEG